MPDLALIDVLADHRIVLCGGSGGVGKTTTAAAVAMLGAAQGHATLVVTIDPARRLADAMGLDSLGHVPQQVPGVENLHAMMLDAGQTIDELVTRHARSAESANRILTNPYYRQLSTTLSGSREFMAIEKLYELANEPSWDLIVVDTPPTQHALDFLDAPGRLLELLDGSGLGLILRSTNVANRLSFGMLRQGQKQFARFFEALTGHRLLVDVTDFYHRYADVIDGFRRRARKIEDLLRAQDTTFLLVLIPETDLAAQAGDFQVALEAAGMHLSGVIFNQVLSIPALGPEDELNFGIGPALLDRAVRCHARWFSGSRSQQEVMAAWRETHGSAVLQVPRFGANVSTIDDLERFAAGLMA